MVDLKNLAINIRFENATTGHMCGKEFGAVSEDAAKELDLKHLIDNDSFPFEYGIMLDEEPERYGVVDGELVFI